MPRWLVALLLFMLGAAAGLSYGWFIAPVEYVDTTPPSLRGDYRADFILMVAERYHADHDLESARRQISILGGQSPAELAAAATSFARTASFSASDIELIQQLHHALETTSPTPVPARTVP